MSYTILETCSGCTACVRLCPVGAIRGEPKHIHQIDTTLCIACGACGRICPSQAVLDETGQLAQRLKRSEWLMPVWIYRVCIACRICVAACPTGAIGRADDPAEAAGVQLAYPFLKNPKACIGCSFCQESCPTAAILMTGK
jgi:formate hydrogenlyase subunit 6/NADH:ubiquinone oxidoreductase subunit I